MYENVRLKGSAKEIAKWNRDLAPNFDPRIARSNTFLHRFFWKPCCSNSLLEKEKKRKIGISFKMIYFARGDYDERKN